MTLDFFVVVPFLYFPLHLVVILWCSRQTVVQIFFVVHAVKSVSIQMVVMEWFSVLRSAHGWLFVNFIRCVSWDEQIVSCKWQLWTFSLFQVIVLMKRWWGCEELFVYLILNWWMWWTQQRFLVLVVTHCCSVASGGWYVYKEVLGMFGSLKPKLKSKNPLKHFNS